jgi:sterol desaturase/sphingolipid hydroxylase (fatty acid hydroxylase superfamily)
VSGPLAVGTGVVATSAWVTSRTNAVRMWEKGQRHDRGAGPLGWTAAIIGWDFIYYWNHRMMHEVRGLWAHHVVHHSSERYNLSTALRQPVADVLGVYLPYGLMARVGIRPALISQARGINLLYQYWIHTDTIRSIGAGEQVLNTPSHHRVHHGSNPRYLDRNHGSILIVWDRLFGTFQREEEPVVYGLTKNIDTYDPVRIAGHEYADIVRDIAHSSTWHDRLSFVLRGPGWAYRRHAERAAGGVS